MEKILEVQDLRVRFPVTGGVFARKVAEVRAVDGVSFELNRGETLGLVGESGCGKSTVGRAIVNILRAMNYGVEIDGKVLYHHPSGVVDLAPSNRSHMRPYRSDIQMIFQDPYSVAESANDGRPDCGRAAEDSHEAIRSQQRKDRVAWLLGKVGFSGEQSNRYPHEFSGGQRQRIGIARALATNPKIVIADEPVSALDVSIQAQVVNLMQDLQEEFELSYIFIAHDLSVVRHISESHCRDVSGEYRRDRSGGMHLQAAACTRIRVPCCPPFPGRIPTPPTTVAYASPAMFPTQFASHPAAVFEPAAPSRSRPARKKFRRWNSEKDAGSPVRSSKSGKLSMFNGQLSFVI